VLVEQLISPFRKIQFDLETSDAGGKRAATLHSLLETAKLNGLNPEAYLREVLTAIADYPVNRVEELLPWRLHTDAAK